MFSIFKSKKTEAKASKTVTKLSKNELKSVIGGGDESERKLKTGQQLTFPPIK